MCIRAGWARGDRFFWVLVVFVRARARRAGRGGHWDLPEIPRFDSSRCYDSSYRARGGSLTRQAPCSDGRIIIRVPNSSSGGAALCIVSILGLWIASIQGWLYAYVVSLFLSMLGTYFLEIARSLERNSENKALVGLVRGHLGAGGQALLLHKPVRRRRKDTG